MMREAICLDRIILSTNTNPKYIDFWPVVSKVWKSMFHVEVELVVVEDGPLPDWVKPSDTMTVLPMIEGLPAANVAKMARHFQAGQQDWQKTVMVNDIDVLPLNQAYIAEMIDDRPQGHLLVYGPEHYKGPEHGKWWLPYTTGEAELFATLLNPNAFGWEDFVRSFVGAKKFDHKEDISNPIRSEHHDSFSDESVYRMCLSERPTPTHIQRRAHYPGSTLDRVKWHFDPRDVERGLVYDAHLPRPYKGNEALIQPLLDYLEKALQRR